MGKKFNPNNSFEIKNSKDFFGKLRDEYNDFDREHLNPRHAINCAITSWHLTDWTYQEFFKTDLRFQDSKEGEKKTYGLSKYQKHLKAICSELEYMRMITNGSKHCKINKEDQTVVSSGDFSPYDYDRNDYNVPRFIIVNDVNSEEHDFESLLLKTIDFWKIFLDDLYN